MRHPGWTGQVVVAVALVLVSVGGSACSGSTPVDPAIARRDRVEARLRSSFSVTQTRCILDDLGASDLRALDRKKDLASGSEALKRYSAAISSCVTSPGSSSDSSLSTTSGATTTTTTGVSSGG